MPPPATPTPEGLWDGDYVNKDHVEAFAHALSLSDQIANEGEASPMSPMSPRSPPLNFDPHADPKSSNHLHQSWKYGQDNSSLWGKERIEKLSATSDFAPIHQRVSRRRGGGKHSNQGWTYHLMRWPLLLGIFFIIYMEFSAYILTRQVVNLFEWILARRGHKRQLRLRLRKAKTYEEWIKIAKELDQYMGFDDWKENGDDGYFDYTLVKRVKRTLHKMRAAKDTRGLMDTLAVCVRSNFAGTESSKMYSESFYGTKYLVEAHIREVAASIDFVRTATNVSPEEKRAFFRAVNKNYGSSALCLSGGASFGYYHFGVVKAFLDADLLPRVVTGTSAGGIVAALLCTRTDAELKHLLVPELANKITACEDAFGVWIKRWYETGARFSAIKWAEKAMFFTNGSLTFKEAYERTGRALNVSVVPSDRHSPTILLNHLTAPNCIIWSAIIASAAVPGILNPVVLMAKDRNGQVKPHNLGGSRFKDGSLREDIPLGSLHTQFNCNFSIVSQTNPHIHLFFFAPRGSVGRPVANRKGKGWRGGFILSALESYIKLDLSKHFKVIRDLDLLPQILQSDWSGVFLQRFSGDLTLTPKSTVGDWFRILSDPNPSQLETMLAVGQRVTWPSLNMVKNRLTIERAILRGRTEIRANMRRDKTTTDQGQASSRRPETGNQSDAQVPIESDADAGFASRSRRVKHAKDRGISARDVFGEPPEPARSVRRRKSSMRPSSSTHRSGPETTVTTPPDMDVDRSLPPPRLGDSPNRGYAASLSDAFRHVRASSLSAFGQNSSPFRSVRFGSEQEIVPTQPRQKSSLSISRWFGGASESSSDEETADEGDNRGSASGLSGDDALPTFRFPTDDEVVVDDDESSDEGEIPIPGGERVDASIIDGSSASGDKIRPDRDVSRANTR